MKLVAGTALLWLAGSAFAQAPPAGTPGPPGQMAPRIQGTVQSLNGSTLTIKTADGTIESYTLPADASIRRIATKTVADLKPGQFVGSTSVPGEGSKRRATEVHIISESERGVGEGHRPMDQNRTMTNGNVDSAAAGGQNKTLTISYKGGSQVIDVSPDTPVTSMDPATRDQLQPGTAVMVMAGKDATGKPVANRVMIGTMPGR